jgi:hypothetical protein
MGISILVILRTETVFGLESHRDGATREIDVCQEQCITSCSRIPVIRKNSNQSRHPEGAYYLEWRENGKRVRLSIGKDAADANARRLRKKPS